MQRAIYIFWAMASACGDKDSSPVDDDGDGVAPGADCDDNDALVHPGAAEYCNGIDDDCDGPVDEDAVDAIAVFTDADADGFGDAKAGTACTLSGDQSAVDGDCDDHDPARHPDALEICNGGIDDDCDGNADDADDDVAQTTASYSDLDGDGFGGGIPIESCEHVGGLLEDGSDCDDGDPSVHPGAPELCNDLDDDCDAVTTEAGVVSVDGVAYREIQSAVDAVPAVGVVAICEGTWYENVVIDKDIVLEGRGPELSIIDGTESGSVVSAGTEGIDLTLRGLTLQHGSGDDRYNFWITEGLMGGGVEASRAGALTIEDCVIADNTADSGAGVMGPWEGDSVVTDTVIRGNDAIDDGGGGYFGTRENWTTDIRGSEISDNTAGCTAGGLALMMQYDPATATVSDTLIDGNVVALTDDTWCYDGVLRGGGIRSTVYLTLTAVTISNNVAGEGGGINVLFDTTADDKTVVSGNSTHDGGKGGGVAMENFSGNEYTDMETIQWRYGTIEDNTASYGGGVALMASSNSSGSTLRDVTVQGNHATVLGGGVYMPDDATSVRDSTISSNTSDGDGGGIGVRYRYSGRPSGSVFLGNVVITSNTAKVAGGGARVELDLESDSCDWGTGVTDNAPDDVSLYANEEEVTYDEFAAAADFVCDVSDLVCE